MKKYILIISIAAVTFTDAKKKSYTRALCKTEARCTDMKNKKCSCYCAFKPGPRLKDAKNGDAPIFIKNDPLGNQCYCQQRDLDKLGLTQ